MKASDAVQTTADRGHVATDQTAASSISSGFSDALIKLLSLTSQASESGKLVPAVDTANTTVKPEGFSAALSANPEIDKSGALAAEITPVTLAEEVNETGSPVAIANLTDPAVLDSLAPDANPRIASNADNLKVELSRPASQAATITSAADATTADEHLASTPVPAVVNTLAQPVTGQSLPNQTAQPVMVAAMLNGSAVRGKTPPPSTQPSIEANRNGITEVPVSDTKNIESPTPILKPVTQARAAGAVIQPGIAASSLAFRRTTPADTTSNLKQQISISDNSPESTIGTRSVRAESLLVNETVEPVQVEVATIEKNRLIRDAQMIKLSLDDTGEAQQAATIRRSQSFAQAFSHTESPLQPSVLEAAKAALHNPSSSAEIRTPESASLISKSNSPQQYQATQNMSPNMMAAAGRNVQWMLDQGISRATMQLHPAELGSLRINIEVQDEQLAIQLTATQAGTREALELSIPRLREQLSEQGFQGVQIDLGQHSGDARQESNSDQSDSTGTKPHSTEVDNPVQATNNPPQTLNVSQGLVDMFA